MRPPYLSSGDTIGIVAPARKISKEELSAAIDLYKSWGLKVVLGKNLFSSCHQFSGTDAERASDFQDMLDNPDVNAIFCARGGYGTVRIIDKLCFDNFEKRPKWIVGYSDITVLHSHILQNFGIETIHAAMPINFGTPNYTPSTVDSLRRALFGETLSYSIAPHPLNRIGQASGILCGGNLSVLYSLLGSKSDVDLTGKILFIEDLDEYLYHIDRMMMGLSRAGKLDKLAALLIGGMSKMNDNNIPYGSTAYETIKEKVNSFNYPVCYNFPAGHTDENMAMYLGRHIKLNVEQQIHLTFV